MTLARLLLAAILLCSLTAFAQDQKSNTSQIPGNAISSIVTNKDAMVTLADPWNILPDRPADWSSDSKNRILVNQFDYDRGTFDFRSGRSTLEAQTRTPVMGLDGALDADSTCYAIRSYVVERDAKDSDSTHPSGYSTCRRASRYHLKTAVEEPAGQ